MPTFVPYTLEESTVALPVAISTQPFPNELSQIAPAQSVETR
jgi:hypothetical protein